MPKKGGKFGGKKVQRGKGKMRMKGVTAEMPLPTTTAHNETVFGRVCKIEGNSRMTVQKYAPGGGGEKVSVIITGKAHRKRGTPVGTFVLLNFEKATANYSLYAEYDDDDFNRIAKLRDYRRVFQTTTAADGSVADGGFEFGEEIDAADTGILNEDLGDLFADHKGRTSSAIPASLLPLDEEDDDAGDEEDIYSARRGHKHGRRVKTSNSSHDSDSVDTETMLDDAVIDAL